MQQRVLITGITGFTGRHMRVCLESAGYVVFGNSRSVHADSQIIQADLCDLEATRTLVETVAPDIVIHMAGESHVMCETIADLYLKNTVTSRHLLQALYESKKSVQSVLMVSSAYVYGNATSPLITEDSPIRPVNDYSVSKIAMEQLCGLWQDKVPTFVVRPFNYTGVGHSDRFLIPKIVHHYVHRKKKISLGRLDFLRELNDVRSVVAIYRKLLQVNPVGRAINICSERCKSINDVIAIMNDLAGYEITIDFDPRFVRDNDVKTLRGSNALLKELVGPVTFRPLEDTLRWMYDVGCEAVKSNNPD